MNDQSDYSPDYLRHNYLKRRELNGVNHVQRLSIREKIANGLGVDQDAWEKVPPLPAPDPD